ncbi:MAG: adenylate/guanylate cyclase domain-containing protein [Ilumatobacteraceae bacterium]
MTFLFTDIEGSTRRWERDSDGMRADLAAHDDVLRSSIESRGGWLFKHTGDGVCAAFESPQAALDAAVGAQRLLTLPVRMGIATGDAEKRGEDYFGPGVNRAARVMGVGHGGQILVSGSTAGLVSRDDLIDLGAHRLRDLSGVEHLFQAVADGLASDFPRLTTVDEVPGNLPVQATSFVGRDAEVQELIELVRQHRLVTLTGVGGVGKTRLAVQVAADLVPEFGGGVWLVELASVGERAAVPDAVATALGIMPQPGRAVITSIAETLAGRTVLVVLDNCEHVLDVAAELIEAILASSSTVSIIATSREGLRVGGEYLWPVPSLDVREGAGSSAVELFVERAHAAVPGFSMDTTADTEAVTEICRRLDGIALAIELAAVRMVSMTPVEVLARLNDRFRLLSGSRRGLERHQTLRQAVQWSYDLLNGDEQCVLGVSAVFAGGFEVGAVTAVCDCFDEYTMLDVLDSLVRKSLVTTSRVGGRTRYGLLETIRQFAEDQHASIGVANPARAIVEIRDRHASYFATRVAAATETFLGPRQREVTEWVEVELDNLRAAFHWATDRDDLDAATSIAAHATMIAFNVQQLEPIGWAEALLPAAVVADVVQLPRLYVAASYCVFAGRPDDGVKYAQAAVVLQADSRYQSFEHPIAIFMESQALLYSGQIDRCEEICTTLAAQAGMAQVLGLCGLTSLFPLIGRVDEAIAIADETMDAARDRGVPSEIAFAYYACGLAFLDVDPPRALDIYRDGFAYAREHRLLFYESALALDAAGLEALHGDRDRGLELFASTIDAYQRAGDTPDLALMFANLAVFFDRINQPEIAAIIYGASTHQAIAGQSATGATAVEHLRETLDGETFDDCVRTGSAMGTVEAVKYAHEHIESTRRHPP